MENFNVVPSQGKFGESISAINQNFQIAQQEMQILENIASPSTKHATVVATSQTESETDVLPSIGSTDTIYRVGNWDGAQFDETSYTEYAWDGTQYLPLSTNTQIGEVFDISEYKAVGGTLATFADLGAALNDGNNVPVGIRKGGMSVKFVQSSDNKYHQYRLTSTSFSTSEDDWTEGGGDGVYDVSEKNGGISYPTLSSAIASISQADKNGGMTIKFKQSSSDLYKVEYYDYGDTPSAEEQAVIAAATTIENVLNIQSGNYTASDITENYTGTDKTTIDNNIAALHLEDVKTYTTTYTETVDEETVTNYVVYVITKIQKAGTEYVQYRLTTPVWDDNVNCWEQESIVWQKKELYLNFATAKAPDDSLYYKAGTGYISTNGTWVNSQYYGGTKDFMPIPTNCKKITVKFGSTINTGIALYSDASEDSFIAYYTYSQSASGITGINVGNAKYYRVSGGNGTGERPKATFDYYVTEKEAIDNCIDKENSFEDFGNSILDTGEYDEYITFESAIVYYGLTYDTHNASFTLPLNNISHIRLARAQYQVSTKYCRIFDKDGNIIATMNTVNSGGNASGDLDVPKNASYARIALFVYGTGNYMDLFITHRNYSDGINHIIENKTKLTISDIKNEDYCYAYCTSAMAGGDHSGSINIEGVTVIDEVRITAMNTGKMTFYNKDNAVIGYKKYNTLAMESITRDIFRFTGTNIPVPTGTVRVSFHERRVSESNVSESYIKFRKAGYSGNLNTPYDGLEFTFDVHTEQVMNKGNNSVYDEVGQDSAVIVLPNNYDQNGDAVRLIIYHHGAGGTTPGDVHLSTALIQLKSVGYAILTINGLPSTKRDAAVMGGSSHMGSEYSIASSIAAYNYVIENYNIKKDGVVLVGQSMGGLGCMNLANTGAIPICAIALDAPVLDIYHDAYFNGNWNVSGTLGGGTPMMIAYLYNWSHCNWEDYTYSVDNDVTWKPLAELKNNGADMEALWNINADKMVGFNPYKAKDLLINNKDGNLYYTTSGADETAVLGDNEDNYYGKILQCPIKIWFGRYDGVNQPAIAQRYIKKIKNVNGQGQIVLTNSMSHLVFNEGGNVTVDGVTMPANLANVYLWIKRFG